MRERFVFPIFRVGAATMHKGPFHLSSRGCWQSPGNWRLTAAIWANDACAQSAVTICQAALHGPKVCRGH